MFKIGDRVKVTAMHNQIGTIVDQNYLIYVLFDDKSLNKSPRNDGSWGFNEEDLVLYTIDQTKGNLLDE